ncbi:MAG: hypothetical protein ACOC1O_04195 [bacterium]
MIAIYNSYPKHMMIYFLEDTGDKVKKLMTISFNYSIKRTHYKKLDDAKLPRSMYEEDKNKTVDKLDNELKRNFIKGLFK